MKKTAVITGASRGIGRAVAEEFAKHDYDLVLVCHKNLALMASFAGVLEQDYKTCCICRQGNIGEPAFVKDLFNSIPKTDVLVNNAGISYFGLLQDMSDEEWDNVISVNLSSVFYTCRAAIPLMLQQGHGKIINVSSVWGSRGASLETAYSASKGGVDAFTRALAKELAPSNIQVNAVACGLIDTDMNKHLSDEELKDVINEIPSDRMGRPEEAASLIYHITESPDYLTGQVITLDGGWM